MTCTNSITQRHKGQHLTEIERGKIAAWHSEGMSNRQVAKKIGVAPQTIHNLLNRFKRIKIKFLRHKTNLLLCSL
ncbi:helix-turn-helix domain-containing protein [Enterococcus olivae]